MSTELVEPDINVLMGSDSVNSLSINKEYLDLRFFRFEFNGRLNQESFPEKGSNVCRWKSDTLEYRKETTYETFFFLSRERDDSQTESTGIKFICINGEHNQVVISVWTLSG